MGAQLLHHARQLLSEPHAGSTPTHKGPRPWPSKHCLWVGGGREARGRPGSTGRCWPHGVPFMEASRPADVWAKTPSLYLICYCSSQILTNSLFPTPISISNEKDF